MATETPIVDRSETVLGADAGLRFVARQPILDAKGAAHAYALMFRGGLEKAILVSPESAVSTVMDHACVFGLETLTGGLPGFVTCTGQSLSLGLVHLLPTRLTILELQDGTQPTPELIAACHFVKAAGFRLSFGNFCWERRFEALMRLADFVKVDCALLRRTGMSCLRQRAGGRATTWVAKNVETQEDFQRARSEGFTLFQGYYFCHPELIKNRALPANRISQIRILAYLQSSALDMHTLSRLVMEDTGLTVRLMLLVNSPLVALRREIGSIEAALMVVGEEAFRRMVTLALASELNTGGSAELLRLALVRARFCELAAPLLTLQAEEQYLLGMLSLLPAMLKIAMEELTPHLPLRVEIRQALLGEGNAERSLLRWLEMFEQGQWSQGQAAARAADLAEEALAEVYIEAVSWAEMVTQCAH